MSTNSPFGNVQAPTPSSTAPLAGIYNIDQMPPLTFQNGAQIGTGLNTSYVAATNTSAFTATAAQIAAGADNALNLTGALGAGAAITMPTAAAIGAQIAAVNAVNQSINLRIINSSSGNFAWTVTTNTGLTLNGTQTIAQNTWRDYYVTVTAVSGGLASAVTFQSIGTGTQS
jgi:hypothetical protein